MLNFLRLLLQNFLGQVVKHMMMAAGKVADEARNAFSIQSLQRQRRQMQTGSPAFGARFQFLDLIGGQRQRLKLLKEKDGEKITKDRLRPVILVSDILPRLESGGFGRPTTRNE